MTIQILGLARVYESDCLGALSARSAADLFQNDRLQAFSHHPQTANKRGIR